MVPAANQQHVRNGCCANARQSTEAFVHALVERIERRTFVARLAGIQAECQEILLVESDLHGMKIGKGAHKERGTQHEHQGKSNLGHDEKPAEIDAPPAAAWARSRFAILAQAIARISATMVIRTSRGFEFWRRSESTPEPPSSSQSAGRLARSLSFPAEASSN